MAPLGHEATLGCVSRGILVVTLAHQQQRDQVGEAMTIPDAWRIMIWDATWSPTPVGANSGEST